MKYKSIAALFFFVWGAQAACSNKEEISDHTDLTAGAGGDPRGGIVGSRESGGDGGGGAGPGAPGTAMPLDFCTFDGRETRAIPEESAMIDDFNGGTTTHQGNGTHGYWFGNDDGTAGTQQPPSPGDEYPYAALQFEAQPGRIGSLALRVQGHGFSTWGSVVGTQLAAGSEDVATHCLFDASIYDGITFWVRGSIARETGSPVHLTVQLLEPDIIPIEYRGACDPLQGACWDAHSSNIVVSECWQRVGLPFEEFSQAGWGVSGGALDTDQLSSIVFQVSQNSVYDYWIDDLAFYSGEAPASDEFCNDGGGGAGGAP